MFELSEGALSKRTFMTAGPKGWFWPSNGVDRKRRKGEIIATKVARRPSRSDCPVRSALGC